MEFKPQQVEKVHDNDLIYNLFGTNENHCRKNFKASISYPNHLIKPPP